MAIDPIQPGSFSTWSLSKDQTNAVLPERLLLDAVERMGSFREGRVAVHIHLSRLQQHHKRAHYLRIALDTFEKQVSSYAGHIFTLGSGDLFFLGKDVRMGSLITAVDRLRMLLAEDPLAQYNTEDDERSGFATYYDFVQNYDLLSQDVLLLYKGAERLKKSREAEKPGKTVPAHGRPFQPGDLTKLITILERADLTSVIKRQCACFMPDTNIPRPVFEETYVAINDLQRICTPDIDLLSDRWLFHYLSRTLDKRVLNLMATQGLRGDLPFSLNLNVETLLSTEFRRFDEMVPANLRGQVVIEIHKVDVFSDIGAFIFARDFLHDRGYRLCLDGLTHHTLPFFDRNRLGLDLFKIYWAPEGLKAAHPSNHDAIHALIDEYGPDHTILCRAENEEALETGRKLGFTQYQGRYIDHLLNLSRQSSALFSRKNP
jgi:EAL domain-containing protein (putative c-di-GMP-specific phosphodiesterase class I)